MRRLAVPSGIARSAGVSQMCRLRATCANVLREQGPLYTHVCVVKNVSSRLFSLLSGPVGGFAGVQESLDILCMGLAV